jgi:Rod binding domain-containing protein
MGGEILRARDLSTSYSVLEQKFKHFERTLRQAEEGGKTGRPRKLKEAVEEFESLFIYYILKRMRATIPKDGYPGSRRQQEIYDSMLDQELARHLAAGGGIGLSRLLFRQLSENMGER